MAASRDISVVTPTLNSAKTLDYTLLSLREQTGCHLQPIVADSGSSDGTLDICKRWAVPTIYVPPGNMYRAINEGLKSCTTTWLTYLNSDDIVYPRMYERMMALAEGENADIVYGHCDFSDSEGRFLHAFASPRPHELLSVFRCGVMGFIQPTAIFRRTVYEELGGFDDGNFTLAADADFFVRALLRGFVFAHIRETTVCSVRLSASQLSNKYLGRLIQEKRRAVSRAGAPTLADRVRFWRWKGRNVPQYAVRFLRRYLLTGRMRFATTLDPGPS